MDPQLFPLQRRDDAIKEGTDEKSDATQNDPLVDLGPSLRKEPMRKATQPKTQFDQSPNMLASSMAQWDQVGFKDNHSHVDD
jgi:hypothetical protein